MRTLLVFIKLGLIIALGVWLAMQPGRTTLQWFGYDIDVQTGVLIFATVIFALVVAKIYQLWLALLRTPKAIARHMDDRAQDNALAALSNGLSAIAAGDVSQAEKQAERARKYIRYDHGLVPLLDGLTARMKGDAIAAEAAFRELLEEKESAFIGVRGLLQISLDRGQPDQALVLARQAHRMHPKQEWVLKTLYNLELQHRNWDEALKILKHSEKLGVMSEKDANNDRAAMLLTRAIKAQGEGQADQAYLLTKEAYKQSNAFLPAVLAYIPYLLRRDENKTAIKIIEKTWAVNPHPDLIETWKKLAPTSVKKDPTKLHDWMNRLAAQNRDHEDSHLMLASSAFEQRLFGEARAELDAAAKIRTSRKLCQLGELIEKHADNQNAAQNYHEQLLTAEPGCMWVCRITGQTFPAWIPFTPPGNVFNAIGWGYPSHIVQSNRPSALRNGGDILQLIETHAA